MKSLVTEKIDRKLKKILESVGQDSWKDPHDSEYDRQKSEDALFHTIGPLMDAPRWSNKWTSPGEPVAGFVPNGPAPRWTPEELIYAFAGDPSLLDKRGTSGNPRSPLYGNKGGAPLYRLAKRVSRVYNRSTDASFIADMYSNGFVPLVRLMQPGFDEGRSPFISFVMRNIQGAMEGGIGGTEEGIRAKGGDSKSGLSGLETVLDSSNPTEIRRLAAQVKGKYKTTKSHDKDPDNPFGVYSSRFYEAAMSYADALESESEERIERAKFDIKALMEIIEDEAIPIRGAATGMGQAISTPDRKSHMRIASMDAPKNTAEGEASSMAGNIAQKSESDSFVDPEAIEHILKIALENDIGSIINQSPTMTAKYQQMAIDAGAKAEADGSVKIGGRLTVNEFRYIIRNLGPMGLNYPGSGVMRSNISTPRDAPGWWKAGEDPEIEPIPEGGKWTSIWKRNGGPTMGPTEIAQEMTAEVREFDAQGIATARTVKTKLDKSGRDVSEAVSKVAIHNTAKAAFVKIKLIASIERSVVGMDESAIRSLRQKGLPILEHMDIIDRRIIVETCDFILRRLQRSMMNDFFADVRRARR